LSVPLSQAGRHGSQINFLEATLCAFGIRTSNCVYRPQIFLIGQMYGDNRMIARSFASMVLVFVDAGTFLLLEDSVVRLW
jgi:hypothetical protein